MQALAVYEAQICACGFHESFLDPKTNFFTFEKRFCPVCASSDQYERTLKEQDDAAVEHLSEAPAAHPQPADGRRVFLRRLTSREIAEQALLATP